MTIFVPPCFGGWGRLKVEKQNRKSDIFENIPSERFKKLFTVFLIFLLLKNKIVQMLKYNSKILKDVPCKFSHIPTD